MGKAASEVKSPSKPSRLKIEYIPLRKLITWPRNPKGNDIPGLQASFAKFGFVDPPIIDETSKPLGCN